MSRGHKSYKNIHVLIVPVPRQCVVSNLVLVMVVWHQSGEVSNIDFLAEK